MKYLNELLKADSYFIKGEIVAACYNLNRVRNGLFIAECFTEHGTPTEKMQANMDIKNGLQLLKHYRKQYVTVLN